MPLKPELLAGLLHRAVDEPLGIVLETNNVNRLQLDIDNFKRGVKQPGWDDLQCCVPTQPNTLFIIHKSVELDP